MSDLSTVEVAVDQPVEGTFTYALPDSMKGIASTGMRVLAPFGRRKVTGYIVESAEPAGISDLKKLKEIDACLDAEPLFDSKRLEFFKWISSYYLAPLGEVIKTALPAGINSSSKRTVKLTDKATCEPEPAGGDERELIRFIAEKGEAAVTDIEKCFGKKVATSVLYRLVKSGLAEIELKIVDGKVKDKKEKFVALSPGACVASENLSKRALELFEYVAENGELPLRKLIEEMGTTRATVSRLEECGLLKVIEKDLYRDPSFMPLKEEIRYDLTAHQKSVMEDIDVALEKGDFAPFLLEGKTGSGKTEVYLQAIERAGGKAIVLIPEIALTPQLTARFRERFGDRVAVLHSGLSTGERYDQWRKIKKGHYDIVVGARSAIFAPLDVINVIVVDEEHETTYKQEDGIRYNARDLALLLGKMEGALVILGSATPSLESIKNVKEGKLGHLTLPTRISEKGLPQVDLVDMKNEEKKSFISKRLEDLMKDTLQKGQQILLFLNRRGFAPSVLCRDCGHTFKCPNCSVTLIWHQKRGRLRCHYCDYSIAALPICTECSSADVMGLGLGTERLEQDIGELFPAAKIVRMDRDSVRRKGEVEKILHSFENGDTDILIGTQMVAKGHHFPGVTLVGVLMADLSLNIPDFRASERTFQLLTQVAGRAGRGDVAGRVVIQTYNPEHYSILKGGEEDAGLFYEKELAIREELSYPPFSRLLNFKINGREEKSVIRSAEKLKEIGKRISSLNGNGNINILGPAPAPISRMRGRYRWQMIAKSKDASSLHSFARTVIREMRKRGNVISGVRIVPDFDPYSLI